MSLGRQLALTFCGRIVREKIGNMSIKKQFSSEEEWTRALKLMLINLKFLVAVVSRITGDRTLYPMREITPTRRVTINA